MTSILWPPKEQLKLIGTRIDRVDGPAKSSGAAKYSLDINRPGLLYGKILGASIAAGTLKSLDTKAAEALAGVRAVHVMTEPERPINWAGQEIVALAADTEEIATEALGLIKAEYERSPAQMDDADPKKVEGNPRTRTDGDPAAGFAAAAATVSGRYGVATITHCCLEPHGQVSEFRDGELHVWPSTQAVSGYANQLVKPAGLEANKIHIDCQYMGGGFGSKFGPDAWGAVCVELAKKAGKPVKLLLDRDLELMIAGNRPSAFADIKVAADKEGRVTAWESKVWGSSGVGNYGAPPLPYVFAFPNRTTESQGIRTNRGAVKAWRAPGHPQGCAITMAAMEDLAAKLGMDALEFFLKNVEFAPEALRETYREELMVAADLIDYKSKAHPRGDKTKGPVKRGLGISLHTWGGAGHASACDVTINPDGSVEASMGTQDLGVGTRTCIGIVVAETLGLPLEAVQVNIGKNSYPTSGGSGGSTTIGGISSSSRRGAVAALDELLKRVATELKISPDALEAADGKIREKANPQKSIAWKDACKLLGQMSITQQGRHQGGAKTELTGSGVGGVQIADVSVDIETGLVTMNEMVAVQDCGLIIDLKLAESQVYGALIMGITYAIFEEAIYDPQTGRMLNADMEFYRLATLSDVGKLKVHMMTGKGYDERGVIGLGEPPVISPGAAISNAVANAIGVRVPSIPLTPDRVIEALENGGPRMNSFEYASPTDLETAIGLLGASFGETEVLAGGTDLVTSLKQGIVSPKRVVSLKAIEKLKGIETSSDAVHIGAMTPLVDVLENVQIRKSFPSITTAIEGIGSPQIIAMGTIGGDLCQRPRCWYYRQGFGLLGQLDGKSLIPNGDNRYHAIYGNNGAAYFVSASSLGPPLIALGATLEITGAKGKVRKVAASEFFRTPKSAEERENVLAANEVLTRISIPARATANATYEVRQREGLDWPLVTASVSISRKGGGKSAVVLGHVAPTPWSVPEAAALLDGKTANEALATRVAEAAVHSARPLSKNAYKVRLVKTAVKRAILAATEQREG